MFQLHADLLKALAHPRRLEIIHLLRGQELPVSDIHTMLDLPQANVSQHLMILRDAGVVITRREGKQVYYKVADIRIMEASDLLRQVLIVKHKDTPLAGELLLRMSELVPIVQDPVCGMRVSPKTAGFHVLHDAQDYYFCASGCVSIFKKEPAKYV
ncbi:MAG: metalloregulator ArsR/SmtB family transcription factor [Pseudomonadales bacterium]|nr:metalloregulator ArsR/SmtB family transcription factor [Pseudomonadales bacterium]